MAEAYKRLGGVAATTTNFSTSTTSGAQVLYQVPALTSAVISSIVICNQAATSATYRLGVDVAGTIAVPPTAYTLAGYLVFGATIAANDSVVLTLGATLATANSLLFSASATTVNAVAFGTEIT